MFTRRALALLMVIACDRDPEPKSETPLPPGDRWEPCGEGLSCVEGLSCWYQGKTGGPWFDACGVECMTDAECQDQGADVRCVGHCMQTCTQQSDCPGQMACVAAHPITTFVGLAICANIGVSEEPAGT